MAVSPPRLLSARSHPPVVRVRRIPAENFFERDGGLHSLASGCVQREAIERQKLAPFGLDVRAQRIVVAERHVGREGEARGRTRWNSPRRPTPRVR